MTMLRETWDKYVIARDLLVICSKIYESHDASVRACVWVCIKLQTIDRSINQSIIFGRLSQLHIEIAHICMHDKINQSNRNVLQLNRHLHSKQKYIENARGQMQFDNDIIFICSRRCLAVYVCCCGCWFFFFVILWLNKWWLNFTIYNMIWWWWERERHGTYDTNTYCYYLSFHITATHSLV